MPGITNLQQLRAALGGLNNLTDEQILQFVARSNGVDPERDPRYRAMADTFAGYNRTGSDKVKDTVRGLVSGTLGVAKDVAILGAAPIPGVKVFNNPVYNALAGTQESIAMDQSPGLQAQRAAEQRATDIAVNRAAATGAGLPGRIWAGVKAQGSNYVANPALAAQDLIENAPQLLASGLLGRGAEGIAAAARLGHKATEAVAVGTGVAGNAALQGADTASGAFDQAQQAGASYDPAAEAAGRAGLKSAVVSGGLSVLPGATSIERSLLKNAGSRAGSKVVGAVRGTVGEAASEGVDEGYGQYAQNQAAQKFDPKIDLASGVGVAAAKGAVASGPLGAVGGFREAGHVTTAQPRTETGEIDLAAAGTSLGAAPPRRGIDADAASQIVAPQWATEPGAGAPRPAGGVDFQHQELNPSRLSLVDPNEEARARAATIDFTPSDTTPAWTTAPGAREASNQGDTLPPREVDTGSLALTPKGQETVTGRPNVSQLVTALQKASTSLGARVVRKDGEVANTAAAAPLREVIQAKDPLEKIRELYQDGKHPRDELLDLWHKELTGQTVGEARSAPQTNSAGFVSEPLPQINAQLQALRQGRIDTVVLGKEDAAKVDLAGLKTGIATGPDGASAVVASRDAAKVNQAIARAKEVGLKQAMGEIKGVVDPTLTSAPNPNAVVVQRVDQQTGQPLHEELVNPADIGKVKPVAGTQTNVASPNEVVTQRQSAAKPEGEKAKSAKKLIQTVESTKDAQEYDDSLYALYKLAANGDAAAFNYFHDNGYYDDQKRGGKLRPAQAADMAKLRARWDAERGQERGQKFGAVRAVQVRNPDDRVSTPLDTNELPRDGAQLAHDLATGATSQQDREVAQRIAPHLVGVDVVVARDGVEVPEQIAEYFDQDTGSAAGATAYDAETGDVTVYIDPRTGAREDVALHELIHAATMRAIDTPANSALRSELEDVRKTILHALSREKHNLAHDPRRTELGRFFSTVIVDGHELLAYAFSSPTLRGFLSGLDAQGNPLPRTSAQVRRVMPNLWQRLVNTMRRLIGLGPAYTPYMQKVSEGGMVITGPDTVTMYQRLDGLLNQALGTEGAAVDTGPKFSLREVEDKSIVRPIAQAAKAVTADVRALASGNKLSDSLLNMLTLRQIEEQYGNKLPAFKDWAGAIFERSSKGAKMAAEADRLAQRWQEIKQTEQRQLAEILLRASNSELRLDDVSPEYLNGLTDEDRREHANLRAKLHLLSPDAQAIRKEALAILRKQWENTRAALEKFISLTVPDPGLRDKRLADLRKEFGRNNGDYFPLSRFGDEIVIARGAAADGRDIVTFHESTHSADQEVERLRAAGAKQVIRTQATATDARKVASTGFMREMHQLIDTNLSGGEAAVLHEALQQLYLKSLPELSGAKHMIRRENIEGYSTDALRAFADAVSRGARYAAHLEYGPAVHAAMESAEVQSRSSDKRTASVVIGRKDDTEPVVKIAATGTDRLNAVEALQKQGYDTEFFDASPDTVVERLAGALEDATPEQLAKLGIEFKKLAAKTSDGVEDLRAAKQMYNYMVRSQQVSLSPAKGLIGEKGVELAGQLGYAWYLGLSPAFWAMNTLQNPMIGIPHLSAKYGVSKSSRELLSAAKWFATVRLGKLMNDRSTPFSVEYLRDQVAKGELKGLSKLELDMLQRLEDRQVLDFTQAMDLSRIGTASNSSWYKAMRIAAAGAHHTEVFNRVSFALAAYRLALKSGSNVSHEDAVRAAEKDVASVHFDYSYANKPLWMGKSMPAMRLVFMFQQYRQHMLYWWANTIKDAVKGAAPEDRSQARKAALLMATTQGVFAGTMGLPFIGAVATVANMLGGGAPGEEPFDFERWMQEAALGVTGSQAAANVLTKGVFAALGADVSKRIGQADLLPFLNEGSARYQRDFQDKTRAYLFDMLGPLGSMALGVARSVDAFDQGDTLKGIAAMAPKAVSDIVRAYDQQVNGLKDKRGQFLARAEAFDGLDAAMQALGVMPTSAANIKQARGSVLDYQAQLKDDTQRLTRNFVQAWTHNDPEGVTEALADIQKFNQAVAKRGLGRVAAINAAQLKGAIMDLQRRQMFLAATGGLADNRRQLILAAEVSGLYDLNNRGALIEAIGQQYGLPGLPGLPGQK